MKKKRVIIWGTEYKAIKLYHHLNFNYIHLLGFCDNSSKERIDNFLFGCPYVTIDEALIINPDYFLIASSAFRDITAQLESRGIGKECIVQIYNVHFMLADSLFYNDELDCNEDKYKIINGINSFACGRT